MSICSATMLTSSRMDRPTLLDLWAHAFVAEIIAPPIDSPLKRATLAFANLTRHYQRLQARLYP